MTTILGKLMSGATQKGGQTQSLFALGGLWLWVHNYNHPISPNSLKDQPWISFSSMGHPIEIIFHSYLSPHT